MEVWIFLAAAGSGYLAQCLQNAQKTNGLSAEEADGDNVGLSSHLFSSNGGYHQLPFLSRQQAERFKGNPNWGCSVSKSHQVVGDASTGCARERKAAGADDLDEGKIGRKGCALHNVPGSGTRKIRMPNKNGRSRGFLYRRKSLATRKPVTSQEISLYTQLDEGYSQVVTGDGLPQSTLHSRDACEQPVGACMKHLGSQTVNAVESDNFLGEGSVTLSKVDFTVGLPSLSRQLTSRKSMNKMRKTKNLTAARATHQETVSNPFKGNSCKLPRKLSQGNVRGWENTWTKHDEECSTSLDRESFHIQGIASSSLKGLLFNFGVGVGMMFTIMTNIRDLNQLSLLLKEADCLLKDLEGELEGRENLRFECNYSKDPTEVALVEQTPIVKSMLRKVRSVTELLNSVRVSLPNDLAPVSATDHIRKKEMAKLEAELEAELESMGINLNNGDVPKYCRRYSGLSKFDADVGSLVQGELSTSSISCELVEADSEEEDGSDFLHEDLHFGNSAVSPGELAIRLHEVLEARQEKQILELEAELKLMSSRLQAQEDELHLWKKRSLGLLPGNVCESLPSFQQKDNHMEVMETTKKEVLSSMQVEKHRFSPTMHHSPDVSPVSQKYDGLSFTNATNHTAYRSSSLHQRVALENNTTFNALGGKALAAYNEACDEFSDVWSDAAMGPPVTVSVNRNTENPPFSENGVLKCATAKGQDLDLIHQDNFNHWEEVDLLSFLEDISVSNNSERMVDLPTLGYALIKSRNSQYKIGSKSVDLSDDTANDTSSCTPCSVKFMDMQTLVHCHTDGQLESKIEVEANSSKKPPNFDWSGEVLFHSGANSPSQDKPLFCRAQDVIDIAESYGQFGSVLNWSMSEDSSYSSDLDDQLGQLLIKRIVEKSRRGSSIIEAAQSVLASFESDETPLTTT